jgi:hypothetical protein
MLLYLNEWLIISNMTLFLDQMILFYLFLFFISTQDIGNTVLNEIWTINYHNGCITPPIDNVKLYSYGLQNKQITK